MLTQKLVTLRRCPENSPENGVGRGRAAGSMSGWREALRFLPLAKGCGRL
jgi:hypothetical protein